jgi:hypothetical protein
MSLTQTRPPTPETEQPLDLAAEIIGHTIAAARNPLLNTPELGARLHALRKQLPLGERGRVNALAHSAYLRECYSKPIARAEDWPECLLAVYRSHRPDRRGWFRAVIETSAGVREVETADYVREASRAA